MKKFRTLVALAALAPVLTACGPAPEAVCDHVIDIMKKEMGELFNALPEEERNKMRDECIAEAKKEKEMKGAVEYKKQATCIMDAGSLADLEKCDSGEEKK
ncbi:MAG TPA: hypothetical protein VK034_29245 [Enhygromyxa sp.]|nr:hypothetical protein [Enhygromyxa sp.]